MANGRVKLKKIVIDSHGSLIGFIVEAPASFFGNIGTNIIEYPKTLADLRAMKFCNRQVDMSNNRITELGSFKVNSLPCMVYDSNSNTLNDVSSDITLVRRYTSGSKVVGYGVRYEGFPGKPEIAQRTEVITQLAKWMRPTNFMVRHNYDTGKMYLNGKGCTLSSLPEQVVGDRTKRRGTDKPVKARNQGQVIKKGIDPDAENKFDILDIYQTVANLGGQIIHFPNEKYEPLSDTGVKQEEGFHNSNLGELASPYLDFNSQKLKVNAQFKKLGYVQVDLGRGPAPVNTYIHRTKSIFVAGKAYIKHFGVVVDKSKEASLMNALGNSLAIKQYDLGSLTSAVARFGNVQNPVCFSVDASNLSLISPEKSKTSILKAEEIAGLCKLRFEAKLVRKFYKDVQKDAKALLGVKTIAEVQHKEIYSEFRMYSDEVLNALRDAGFDIYSGGYSKPASDDASKEGSKTSKSKSADEINISYYMKEYDDSKITAADLKKAVNNEKKIRVSERILDALRKINTVPDPKERYIFAERKIKAADKQLGEIEKKLWMHNATMFKEGGKQFVHTHDFKEWEPIATRSKLFETYGSKKVNGLVLKLSGLRMKNA